MDKKRKFQPNPDLKLMDQVTEVLRYHHYALRTEQTYCEWIKRFLKFYGYKTHPREMGAPEVERFLSHLVPEGGVVRSMSNRPKSPLDML